MSRKEPLNENIHEVVSNMMSKMDKPRQHCCPECGMATNSSYFYSRKHTCKAVTHYDGCSQLSPTRVNMIYDGCYPDPSWFGQLRSSWEKIALFHLNLSCSYVLRDDIGNNIADWFRDGKKINHPFAKKKQKQKKEAESTEICECGMKVDDHYGDDIKCRFTKHYYRSDILADYEEFYENADYFDRTVPYYWLYNTIGDVEDHIKLVLFHDYRGTCVVFDKFKNDQLIYGLKGDWPKGWIKKDEKTESVEKEVIKETGKEIPLSSRGENYIPEGYELEAMKRWRQYILSKHSKSYDVEGYNDQLIYGLIETNNRISSERTANMKTNSKGQPSKFDLPEVYHSRHCKKCGHSYGCMCLRPNNTPEQFKHREPECRHVFELVNSRIATEIGFKTPIASKVYICRKCLKAMTQCPNIEKKPEKKQSLSDKLNEVSQTMRENTKTDYVEPKNLLCQVHQEVVGFDPGTNLVKFECGHLRKIRPNETWSKMDKTRLIDCLSENKGLRLICPDCSKKEEYLRRQ